MNPELRLQALAALRIEAPQVKVDAVRALRRDARAGLHVDVRAVLAPPPHLPGRPLRPVLVPPGRVPRRGTQTVHGRAALIHAIAHIEFNAINLALDAIWRFPALPHDYYYEWLGVAAEEAHHFTLLRDHLRTLGHDYGDFAAHDGLWAMAEKTRDDPIARMALVPRLLEARGLDVTPAMQARLVRADDRRAVAILDIILADEVGHVAIGNRWYRRLCAAAGFDPVAHEAALFARYAAPRPRPPFNFPARRAAGFTEEEVAAFGAQI
jgi:uncharacterized ferritin-like protein (DUF455 family)